jgi:ATP-dependent Clp protease, protease subunit
MRSLLEEIIAKHTGKSPEQIRKDIERDKILTAQEAKEYGLVDDIIPSRKKRPAAIAAS